MQNPFRTSDLHSGASWRERLLVTAADLCVAVQLSYGHGYDVQILVLVLLTDGVVPLAASAAGLVLPQAVLPVLPSFGVGDIGE